MTSLLLAPLSLLPYLATVDDTPEPEDVKAGWLAFGIFGLLVVAIVVLGFSLVRHLRTADRCASEGRFDPSGGGPAPRAGQRSADSGPGDQR